jgi:excisionase family DNA binding protein
MRKNQGISAPFESGDLATRIERKLRALTAPELADLLGFGKTAVYDLAKRGGIPHYRVGSSIRFDPARTAAWSRQHEIAVPERRSARADHSVPESGSPNHRPINLSTGSAVTA